MTVSDSRHDLTQGSIGKNLTGFFIPIFMGALLQQLYSTVDAVVVGNFVGTSALAAVGGSAANISFFITGFFIGVASGATVVISQYFGAGDWDNLNKTVHTAMAFCLLVGAALTVVGYFAAPWALELINTPADILADSTVYLRIYFVGAAALMVFNIGSGILRAMGDSKWPLIYLALCTGVNIVLDVIFVAVFGWGVEGVAWATVIALAVSAAFIMVNLSSSRTVCRLEIKKIRIHADSLKRFLKIGIPAGLQSTLFSAAGLILQAAVNGLGTAVVAAMTTVGKLDGIYWSAYNAFGATVTAFAGQAFGGGKFTLMKKGMGVWMVISLGMTLVLSAFIMVFCRPIFGLFTGDGEVINYAVEMVGYFAPVYVVWTAMEVISGTLRGAGDAVRPMIISGICTCLLRVLWCIFVVPRWNTVMGISMCYPVTGIIALVAYLVYYLKGRWLDRCIRLSGIKQLSETQSCEVS